MHRGEAMWWLVLIALPSIVIAMLPARTRSRRRLGVTLAVLLPIVGPLLALVVQRTRGGALPVEPPRKLAMRPPSAAEVASMGEVSSALDRLLSGDPVARLEALVGLSSTGDAAAVSVLRWARDHGPSEVVLDAALTLEELELRSEARLAAARAALDAHETAARALEAADAAADAVTTGIVDGASARVLAEQARGWYARAIALAPAQAPRIEERLARLELAAGRPRVAWMIAERLIHRGGVDRTVLRLRDDAAFAAREFDAMSFAPAALELPVNLAAHRLHTVPA